MTETPGIISTGQTSNNIIYNFNVVLAGNINVGKSAIVNRITKNTFKKDYTCTVGVDASKVILKVDNNDVNICLWDTCGEERFMSLTKQFFRQKNGIILTFDLSNRQSFKSLKVWIDEIKDTVNDSKTQLIIVGNKYDLISKERVISEEEMECEFKTFDIDFEYIEVSAKDDINIKQMFDVLSNNMIQSLKDDIDLNISQVSRDLTILERGNYIVSLNEARKEEERMLFESSLSHFCLLTHIF